MAEDKKVIENRIYRFKILRDRATNQTLAASYQKQIDDLESSLKKTAPKKEKKPWLGKKGEK